MKEIDKLSSKSLDQWPTYAATLKKVKVEEGKETYQCQQINKFSDGWRYYQNSEDFCRSVIECVHSRMSWLDTQLIRDILFMLVSQGWEKVIEENDTMKAIHRLRKCISQPR